MNHPDVPLMRHARNAAAHANAPYSKFHVGAAVLGANGEIVVGCNVESASYGLSCCAERVALFAAVAGGIVPVRLSVACVDAASASLPGLKMPCGGCRQIMFDLMGPAAIVEVDGVGHFTVGELLPHGFSLPEFS